MFILVLDELKELLLVLEGVRRLLEVAHERGVLDGVLALLLHLLFEFEALLLILHVLGNL